MFWKSISLTLMSLGVACVPLLGEDDPQVTDPAASPIPGVRWVEKELTIRTLVPVFEDDHSPDQLELPSRMPSEQIDPTVMQRRMHEWLRQSAGQPFRLVDLADSGSVKTSDLVSYELPGQRMVLRHHSFTIGGLPYVDVVVEPEHCDQASAQRKAPPVDPLQAEPNIQQFPQSAQQAYLRALQQARQAQAMANAFAGGAGIPNGFGSGIGVSVTTGPNGESKVVESYFGAAAEKEGVSKRTYSLPAGSRGHAVGVDATSDAAGNVEVKRYSQPIR